MGLLCPALRPSGLADGQKLTIHMDNNSTFSTPFSSSACPDHDNDEHSSRAFSRVSPQHRFDVRSDDQLPPFYVSRSFGNHVERDRGARSLGM